MANLFNRILFFILIVCIGTGCANIVPPTGGPKDVTPPKLVSVTPADSQLNVKTGKIVLHFDEYVSVNDAVKEVQISPILPIPLTVTGINKRVSVNIPDTLLQDNTTYRISFGNAIKDLHEGNTFKGYTYTFSTGNYFDSLQLNGKVIDAVTGKPASDKVFILLYPANSSDSDVVRKKPLYASAVNGDGSFSIKGLPAKSFRIYALKDSNDNLIYDGHKEWIGFLDSVVTPIDTAISNITLKIFPERITDSMELMATAGKNGLKAAVGKNDKSKEGFTYTVNVDTSDIRKRTKDITEPIVVTFNKEVATINKEHISLLYDSVSQLVNVPIVVTHDTTHNNEVTINAKWKENSIYTLKLLKGFAKDTGSHDAMPSKYKFRTKMDDDYGKLDVHLPPKYLGKDYVLLVKNDKDTVHMQSVTDTLVHLVKLQPANYTILLIVDKNHNGKWDTGDLFKKIQPEDVIPYSNSIMLKAGWENIVDFEEKDKSGKGLKGAADAPHK